MIGSIEISHPQSSIVNHQSPMPRFVLLIHECPGDRPRPTHCDLMLGGGAGLKTWSLAKLPQAWSGVGVSKSLPAIAASNVVEAERLADPRVGDLDTEGPG